MSEGLIFWTRPLRIAGPCPVREVVTGLHAELSAPRGIGGDDRLLGHLDGARMRIWKRTMFGSSADVVQFEGEVAPQGEGAVVSGTLSYRIATRVQFIGSLGVGLFVAAAGAMQTMAGSSGADDVFGFGAVITAVTALWIVTAARMKERQIVFLEGRLRGLVGG